MSEWSKEPDLRPGVLITRGFEPHLAHTYFFYKIYKKNKDIYYNDKKICNKLRISCQIKILYLYNYYNIN